MHPRQMRDTVMPVLPSFVYCIISPLHSYVSGRDRVSAVLVTGCHPTVYELLSVIVRRVTVKQQNRPDTNAATDVSAIRIQDIGRSYYCLGTTRRNTLRSASEAFV